MVVDMLQFMNVITFSEYGRLLSSISIVPNHIILLRAGSSFPFYQCLSPIIIAPIDNMAILQVLSDTGSVDSFYIDKAIELKAGISFAFLPLDTHCSLYCYAEQPLNIIPNRVVKKAPVIYSNIVVKHLCTFYLQEHGPGFFFSGEKHRPYELAYVNRGTLHTIVNGRTFTLEQNEALIIPSECWHVQHASTHSGVSFLSSAFLCASPLPENMLLRVFPAQKVTTELMRTLFHEYQAKDIYQHEMMITTFQSLLVHYVRFSEGISDWPPQVPSSFHHENQILNQAMEYIAEHTREKVTVPILAKQCNISSAHLSLLFRRHLRISPAAYIMQVKLEESRQLIRSGKENIAQIASLLCFSSPQHYSKVFKQKYGYSPKAYAKSLK